MIVAVRTCGPPISPLAQPGDRPLQGFIQIEPREHNAFWQGRETPAKHVYESQVFGAETPYLLQGFLEASFRFVPLPASFRRAQRPIWSSVSVRPIELDLLQAPAWGGRNLYADPYPVKRYLAEKQGFACPAW